MRVAVCDCGVGNLRSVERALARTGAEVLVTADPDAVDGCDGLVLPGVGAFGAAIAALRETGLERAVVEAAAAGRPLLGVCLGFQLLFEHSDESGGAGGLGLLPGRVTRIDAGALKVPHMGWNTLHLARPSPLLDGVAEGSPVYFVHSYAAGAAAEDVVATCEYGSEIVAACQRGNVMGTQFHPEKSSLAGLRIYENFAALCGAAAAAA